MTSIHKYPPSPEMHKRIEKFFSERAYPIAEKIIAEQEKKEKQNTERSENK